MAETKWLAFYIRNGKDLVSKDPNGKSDPFCVVTIEQPKNNVIAKHTTKVQPKTLQPVWNESVKAPLKIFDNAWIRVVCWDHDLIGKDFMGEFCLPVSEIPNGVKTCVVLKPRKKERVSGTIEIEVTYPKEYCLGKTGLHTEPYPLENDIVSVPHGEELPFWTYTNVTSDGTQFIDSPVGNLMEGPTEQKISVQVPIHSELSFSVTMLSYRAQGSGWVQSVIWTKDHDLSAKGITQDTLCHTQTPYYQPVNNGKYIQVVPLIFVWSENGNKMHVTRHVAADGTIVNESGKVTHGKPQTELMYTIK